MSEAHASRVGQRSSTERKSLKSDIAPVLGPFVLKIKDQSSRDCGECSGHNVRMGERSSSQFKAEFIGRVRAARERNFDNQTRFAENVMGMRQDRWKRYEIDTLLPHELIPRFCDVCAVTFDWLVAGRGKGPAWQPYERQAREIKRKKTKKVG